MTTEACRRWRELLGAYALGHLSREERSALEAHLDGCADCTSESLDLRRVASALPEANPAHLGAAPEPPPHLAERVSATIRDARRVQRRHRWSVRVTAGIAAVAAAAITLSVVALLREPAPSHEDREVFAFETIPVGVRGELTLYKRETIPGVEVWLAVTGLPAPSTYAVWVERASTGERIRCGTVEAVRGEWHAVWPSTVVRADTAAVGVSTLDGRLLMRAPVSSRTG